MRLPQAPARPGMSAAEIIVGVLIAAALGVPVLTLLFQGRDTEQRSRFQYLAILAARDATYLSRFLIGCGADANTVEHGDVTLDPGRNLMDDFPSQIFTGTDKGGIPNYHEEQKRISVKVDLEQDSPTARILLGTASARWLEGRGVAPTPGDPGRPGTVTFEFGVLKPPMNP